MVVSVVWDGLLSVRLLMGSRRSCVSGAGVLGVSCVEGFLPVEEASFLRSVPGGGVAFPMEVSLDGTSLALDGMEFSYSRAVRSNLERMALFTATPRVWASAKRVSLISGIQ